jgi:hypothetical protein
MDNCVFARAFITDAERAFSKLQRRLSLEQVEGESFPVASVPAIGCGVVRGVNAGGRIPPVNERH